MGQMETLDLHGKVSRYLPKIYGLHDTHCFGISETWRHTICNTGGLRWFYLRTHEIYQRYLVLSIYVHRAPNLNFN